VLSIGTKADSMALDDLQIVSEFFATSHFWEAYIAIGCRMLTFALARLSCTT